MSDKCKTPYLRVLALSEYGLVYRNGLYYAGCRQGLTAAQALAHWGSRKDKRAKAFTKAIKKNEACND